MIFKFTQIDTALTVFTGKLIRKPGELFNFALFPGKPVIVNL